MTTWKNLAVIGLLIVASTACSTYRFDRADCASIGLFDHTPAQCWCDDADLECLALAKIQGAVERARRESTDGVRLPDAMVSACMLHRAIASVGEWPSIEGHPQGASPLSLPLACIFQGDKPNPANLYCPPAAQ